MNICEHRITVKPLTALQLMESLCDFCPEPLMKRKGQASFHWTHLDLNRRHQPGWLKHGGRIDQSQKTSTPNIDMVSASPAPHELAMLMVGGELLTA